MLFILFGRTGMCIQMVLVQTKGSIVDVHLIDVSATHRLTIPCFESVFQRIENYFITFKITYLVYTFLYCPCIFYFDENGAVLSLY